ncbi:sugar phosphorylase [Parendozoicomonas sp. Alg238-R29]|uniref:sugar phosphorylase n=1 Tax=Parendozoicomonas sp. Alg238-R29 TaxID=2993446 RepID=UPI00248E4958|nr:sugar phosphorylase [Parendozoicomonas sp. Alg238-R29]
MGDFTYVCNQEFCRAHDEGALARTLTPLLRHLYPSRAGEVLEQLLALVSDHLAVVPHGHDQIWDETDIMLITYGDSVRCNMQESSSPPLRVLSEFMAEHMRDCFSSLHILPFYPYSSDDGFSVIDYRMVDPELGDWEDIRRLSREYRFMSDLVINHVSRHSVWFADFVSGHPPGNAYFVEPEPEEDLSQVVRPRNSSLLAPVWTRRGIRHVWATFSKDQIDLNFRNPEVLLEMVRTLLLYMEQGASLIRLDAIAFLWKEPGTSCIHLPQTHSVVKVMRAIMSCMRPDSILLTETNVPSDENLSYFGDGDEAQMVYQFPLPPLILHALNRGTSEHLVKWAKQLPEYPKGCTALNFTASHDGIGLRALEGIVPKREVDDLVETMHRFGGFVSMRALPDGSQAPYEINISLFDAMKGTRRGEDTWQIQRFICSQAIMLAMKGIPAVYIHSLFATENDLDLVEETGRTRSINRKKWQQSELKEQLNNPTTTSAVVFGKMKQLLRTRRAEVCFHPDSPQEIVDIQHGLFSILRRGDNNRILLAVHNVTTGMQTVDMTSFSKEFANKEALVDLVSGEVIHKKTDEPLKEITLQPYQVVWLLSY